MASHQPLYCRSAAVVDPAAVADLVDLIVSHVLATSFVASFVVAVVFAAADTISVVFATVFASVAVVTAVDTVAPPPAAIHATVKYPVREEGFPHFVLSPQPFSSFQGPYQTFLLSLLLLG